MRRAGPYFRSSKRRDSFERRSKKCPQYQDEGNPCPMKCGQDPVWTVPDVSEAEMLRIRPCGDRGAGAQRLRLVVTVTQQSIGVDVVSAENP